MKRHCAHINTDRCARSQNCKAQKACPAGAIYRFTGTDLIDFLTGGPYKVDYSKCIRCGTCLSKCPRGAICMIRIPEEAATP